MCRYIMAKQEDGVHSTTDLHVSACTMRRMPASAAEIEAIVRWVYLATQSHTAPAVVACISNCTSRFHQLTWHT
jgi:hypothetical protein